MDKRIRTNLTSIQVDKAQKETIDKAYNIHTKESPTFVSKGQFIEALCNAYISKRAHPMESDMWEEV